jgi:Protein of unknown function (DUF2800)
MIRSINSASSLSRRKVCPGSANAEKNLPRQDNAYSEEGTLLHWHDAHPFESRDKLTQAQRDILDRNESLRKQFLDRELPRLGISPEAKCVKFIEREFILCDFDGEPVISHGQNVPGHPDLIYWYPEFLVAFIFDSKFGRIEVTAAWLNLQLKNYFVDFCDAFQPETVIVAITQPWAKSPNDFHSAEYSIKDLDAHRLEILDIVRATEPADAPRHASVEACTYCLAAQQMACPIAINAATEMAVIKCNELQPDQLEAIGPAIKLAEQVVDHWYKRMIHILNTFPLLIQNYELKSTGSTRSVANSAQAVKRLAASGLFGESVDVSFQDPAIDQIVDLFDLSLGRLEAYISKKENCTAMVAKQRAGAILEDLLVSVPKEKSLVKKSGNIHTGKVV